MQASQVERALDAHNKAALDLEHVEQPTPRSKARLALPQAELASAVEGHTHVAGHSILKNATGLGTGIAVDAIVRNTPGLRNQMKLQKSWRWAH